VVHAKMKGDEGSAARLRQWIGVTGLSAVVTYVGATIAGSFLNPSYSQVRDHVSDLTATSAPTASELTPVYVFANLLVVAFGIGLYLASDRGSTSKTALRLLSINAIAGVATVTWLRGDVHGTAATVAGAGHVGFAIVSFLAILVGLFVYGFAFKEDAAWRSLSIVTFVIGVMFAVLGPFAAVASATNNDLAGLAERGATGLVTLWLLVVSFYALIHTSRPPCVTEGSGEAR
jgi:Protein of unknown function (DUF998)